MNQARFIRVLVAEDHEIVRDGICAIVNQQEDMRVVAEADDGIKAVHKYREHQPDVVLMDLRMPAIEGVKAIARIKSEFPAAKIIILTTYDTDEDISEDTPIHIEALYRFNLNDNISITPGVVYITNPNQDENNEDIFIGALRTTFSF